MIDGTVLSLFRKNPKANVNVSMLLICDSTSQRGICPTDQEGKFNLALIDFYGNSKLSIETKEKAKRKETNIILNRVFSTEMKAYDYWK